EIQEKFLTELAHKLGSKRKVAKAIMDTLEISQDSCYRRTRGETQFSIEELQKLCLKYHISFDTLIAAPDKNQIFFTKRDLTDLDYNFTKYLEDILVEFQKIQVLSGAKLTIASQDLPIFKLFNFPQLTRFKFYFWSQHIVHKKDKIGDKFKFEKLNTELWNLANNIHIAYAKIPSDEILNPDTLKGLTREIVAHYKNDGFDSKETALKLLHSVRKLTDHMEEECIEGAKKIIGHEALGKDNYRCYLNRSYIPDNTVLVETNEYNSVFLTHNVMNFLSTNNSKYIEDTRLTITGFKRNSDLITNEKNAKIREAFFKSIRNHIAIAEGQIN
ncbi:MAG: helix-turn-helix domain-containing protein, partial [Crocinitomicaceae bacterium]